MKRIAVYCGARPGAKDIYTLATKEVAKVLLQKNIELVYGGGSSGLMGVVAKEVLNGGGKVHGIMPEFLMAQEPLLEGISSTEIVSDMSIRKQKMLQLSDACLALPGGPGTLEEIIEAFSWAILEENDNPCAIYNVDNYYTPLENMFNTMANNGYITKENRDKIYFSDSLDDIFKFYDNYEPPVFKEYD